MAGKIITYKVAPGSQEPGMSVEHDYAVGHVLITTHGRLLASQITQDMVDEGCAVLLLPKGQLKTLIHSIEEVE